VPIAFDPSPALRGRARARHVPGPERVVPPRRPRGPLRRGRAARALLAATVLALLGADGAAALGGGADGRFERRESSHFVLLQDVAIDDRGGFHGSRRFEQEVLKTLEAAYDSVDALTGLRPRRKITVAIYDPGIFDARFAGLFRFPAAGFYGDAVHIRGATAMNPQLARVLHHELVHAAFHAEAPSLVLPAWLNEGVAEWVEARALGQRFLTAPQQRYLAVAASQGRLYSLAQLSAPSFGRLGPDAAQLAYLQSYAFVHYLGRTHGERSIRELVREVMRTGNLERAVSKTFRGDLDDLERRFRSELGL